jgi:hypothetical protein
VRHFVNMVRLVTIATSEVRESKAKQDTEHFLAPSPVDDAVAVTGNVFHGLAVVPERWEKLNFQG